MACKSCGYRLNFNATRMASHLVACQRYLENMIQRGHCTNITRKANALVNSQRTIPFPTLSRIVEHSLDLDAMRVCVIDGLPFKIFESPAMKHFLRRLNPAYKNPPTHNTIAGPLLDKIYGELKQQTDDILVDMPWINVTTDESNNIKKASNCNISIHFENGSLHYNSEDIGAKKMDAVGAANWVKSQLYELSTHPLD